jgi:MerR family mercuric resistance operon transcriptional regulator
MQALNGGREMAKKPAPSPLTIGRLAEATGVHVETIRYYERIHMLASPARSAGGHRHYAREHVASLNFIRRGRELGFPLETIRDLLRLNAGGACCEQARSVTVAHRADVRRKLADLKRLDRALTALIDECEPTRWPQCPIMEALASAQ